MHFSHFFIQKIYRIGFFLVIILVLIDLLVFFYYPETIFSDLFLATREQTPLTWISALTFFFIALSCFSAYHIHKEKVWYFLAIIFFFFSMDDATYLHERVSGYFVDNITAFSSFPTYIWVIIYAPLLLFSLGAFIYFLWKDVSRRRKKIILIALFLLGTAIFLDLLDGFVRKDSVLVFCLDAFCHKTFLHVIRLSEEVLEVFALGVLGYINIQKHCVDKKH